MNRPRIVETHWFGLSQNGQLSLLAITEVTQTPRRAHYLGNGDNITGSKVTGAGYAARNDAVALVVPIDTSYAVTRKWVTGKVTN